MSKTTQENKAKKARQEQKLVEEQSAGTVRDTQETSTSQTVEAPESTQTTTKTVKVRSKKYQTVKAKVDINKYYPLSEAISLVKETSYAKFGGKIEAHITVSGMGTIGDITFPHLKTATKKIAVLDDLVLAAIKDGRIEFDVLIATPATMPKLLPFARVLGPKGLMPNPKSGTLTDDPKTAVQKLSVAKTSLKTEKKAPVIHIVTGEVAQPATELEANVEELIKVIGSTKIKKLALKATMGPAIKVAL